MAVRVRLRIRFRGRQVVTSALANAGYETDDNEVLIPVALAKRLGASRGRKMKYSTAGGDVDFIHVGNARVCVVTPDARKRRTVPAMLLVSPHENEVIINDKLVESLDIDLIRVSAGLWRFLDDRYDKRRPSAPKEWW